MKFKTKSIALAEYEQALQNYLADQEIHFFWKARVGLYLILKAMGVGPGDEVILPAYTCVVVPSSVIYLGATPIYVDINVNTYNSDITNIVKAISSKTRVIICQNTYGLSTDLDEIMQIAKVNGLYTLEDCTHGFGGNYNGTPNGLTCDAAIYSTQWNKPFSTGIGGFAIASKNELNENVRMLAADMKAPLSMEAFQLRCLIAARKYLLNNYTYWYLLKLYRYLSSKGIVVGSSSKGEMETPKMPENFIKGLSNIQALEGIKALQSLDPTLARRKATAKKYTKLLVSIGKNHVLPELDENHAYLKYPLRVKDRNTFTRLAEQAKVELGDWFVSQLHPVQDGVEAWGLNTNDYPNSKHCAETVVNLPTTPSDINKVLVFLESNQNLIEENIR